MKSLASSSFWKSYSHLPIPVQKLAYKNFLLWLDNPAHPSLRFKPLKPSRFWSVRVGDHHRAMGYFQDSHTFVWTWIGSHEQFNGLF